MTYKTIVIDYAPKAKKMAAVIEQTTNEKAMEDWEFVSFSVTHSGKAILVFRLPEEVSVDTPQEASMPETETREAPVQEETAEAVGEME